jgi:hypothetical protein
MKKYYMQVYSGMQCPAGVFSCRIDYDRCSHENDNGCLSAIDARDEAANRVTLEVTSRFTIKTLTTASVAREALHKEKSTGETADSRLQLLPELSYSREGTQPTVCPLTMVQ